MSAAGRGSARIDNDYYPTPGWCVDALLAELRTDLSGLVWSEPCRADGAIYNRLPQPKVWAELRHGVDYLTTPLPADVVVTNPPFSIAEPFIRKSLSEARGVFYLMRLNFLGGQERRKFWIDNRPSHLFVLSRRPAFVAVCQVKGCGAKYPLDYTRRCEACGGPVGPGTDATEYAWFGWDRLGVCRRKPGIYWI